MPTKKKANSKDNSRLNMQVIPVKKILPAEYNPRLDLKPGDLDFEKLKLSINEFGIVDPLIWNKRTGNLVGGHQRFKVLQSEGVKEVECSVVDLDYKREKMLNLALNKIQGDWDFDKLSVVLNELQAAEVNLEICGFEIAEVEAIGTYNPDSLDHLPKVEVEGTAGKKKAFLLMFVFLTEEALEKAKKDIGLSEMRGYTFDSEQFKAAFAGK